MTAMIIDVHISQQALYIIKRTPIIKMYQVTLQTSTNIQRYLDCWLFGLLDICIIRGTDFENWRDCAKHNQNLLRPISRRSIYFLHNLTCWLIFNCWNAGSTARWRLSILKLQQDKHFMGILLLICWFWQTTFTCLLFTIS